MTITAEEVKQHVESELDELLALWLTGRPTNHMMDKASKALIATGYWLDRELRKVCNDEDRRTQYAKYNRLSRTYDPFETAAELMNEALAGTVEQNRKPHRRWG